MKLRRIFILVFIIGTVVTLNIFKQNDDSILVAANISKITLDKSTLSINVGSTLKLTASTEPSNMQSSLIWVSSNKSVVVVDSSGNVKGVSGGSAYVIVADRNNYSTRAVCKVVVNAPVTNTTTNENKTNNNNTNNNTTPKTTPTPNNNQNVTTTKKVTSEDLIKSLEKMSQTARNDYKRGKKWKYSNSNASGTYEKAVQNGNRRTNCAQYVSWALIDIGILEPGQKFYKKSSNTIKYKNSDTKTRMRNSFKYINGNGKKMNTLISEGKLKPGDIVLWYSHQHTNVYAGNRKWYDAGRWSANKGSTGFSTFGPVSISRLNGEWKIWKILRLK
ncbi:MAG: Ig-like domain-containing protein [Bacilli bacterium]|nr:Ig-like domain-containing protein [Bacilli bacterium]